MSVNKSACHIHIGSRDIARHKHNSLNSQDPKTSLALRGLTQSLPPTLFLDGLEDFSPCFVTLAESFGTLALFDDLKVFVARGELVIFSVWCFECFDASAIGSSSQASTNGQQNQHMVRSSGLRTSWSAMRVCMCTVRFSKDECHGLEKHTSCELFLKTEIHFITLDFVTFA